MLINNAKHRLLLGQSSNSTYETT